MSIDGCLYRFFRLLRDEGVFPPQPRVLELGRTHFDSSVPIRALALDIAHYAGGTDERRRLTSRLHHVCRTGGPDALFAVADVFWEIFLRPSRFVSLDRSERGGARVHDLDLPLELGERFDVVMNLGTVEHVFDPARCFRTMHRHARAGGLLVHQAPFSPFHGWYDHGFYNFNPCLWADLAHANAYETTRFFVADYDESGGRVLDLARLDGPEELRAHVFDTGSTAASLLLIVLRKTSDRPFVTPQQGRYARPGADPDGEGASPIPEETATALSRFLGK